MLISGCSLSNIYTILTDSLSLSLSLSHTHTHTHTHTQVVGCLSVRIQANETIDSKHISHAASVCQHILFLSKTHIHTTSLKKHIFYGINNKCNYLCKRGIADCHSSILENKTNR